MTGFVPFSNLSRLTSFGLSPKPVIKGDLLMARSRNIKPAFFDNDKLAELPPLARLLFIGMWTIADFKGDFEWREKRVKTKILPYDNCDIKKLAINLDKNGFIRFYSDGDLMYCNIVNFKLHQNPHKNEKEKGSDLPEITETYRQTVDLKELAINRDRNRLNRDDSYSTPANSLNLIPDSLNPIKTLDQSAIDQEFDKFWLSGIKKVNKKKSKAMFTLILKKTKDQGWSEFTEILIEDVKSRLDSNQLGFSEMHPTTYLNGERWNDEITARTNYETNSNQRNYETPTDRSTRAADQLRRKQSSYAENDISVQTHD